MGIQTATQTQEVDRGATVWGVSVTVDIRVCQEDVWKKSGIESLTGTKKEGRSKDRSFLNVVYFGSCKNKTTIQAMTLISV